MPEEKDSVFDTVFFAVFLQKKFFQADTTLKSIDTARFKAKYSHFLRRIKQHQKTGKIYILHKKIPFSSPFWTHLQVHK